MKKKVLFLNLPGQNRYLRDYYCSKISQANYLLPPIDFIFQSGFLRNDFELSFIDAIVEKKDKLNIGKKIAVLKPHIIIFLAGSVSFIEDILFVQNISNIFPEIQLIGTGDIFLGMDKQIIEKFYFVEAFFDDFTSSCVLRYLKGERTNFTSLMWRDQQGRSYYPAETKEFQKEFDIPCPELSLFLNKNYRYPFVKSKSFSVVLTDYGCPFKCRFCVMPSLGYKIRGIESVRSELEELNRNKVKDLLILDQSFGVNKERSEKILNLLKYFNFRWVGFSRIDLLDEHLIAMMKRAGCHALILGVESGSEEIQEYIGKKITRSQIKRAFTLCEEYSITTIATFILGLPYESEKTIKETWNLINEIKPDYVSFNVAVPRRNTELRSDAIKMCLINPDLDMMDQSGIQDISMRSEYLSKREISKFRMKSVSKFYFRKQFFFKQIVSLSDIYGFYNLIYQGFGVIQQYISSFKRNVIKHEK